MPFVYGPPVKGEQFKNRDKEIYKLLYEIDMRTKRNSDEPHIEISAPRRIGKSSLLLKAQEILNDQGIRHFTSSCLMCRLLM